MKKNRILRIFLIFAIFLTGTIAMNAQSVNVTLNLKDATIREALNEIQKQCDYKFMYNTRLVNVEQKVTVKCDNLPLASAMDMIFSGKNIAWKIADKQIILTATEPGHAASSQSTGTTIKVKGLVSDASTSETLPGVVVKVIGTEIIAVSDNEGKYAIDAPEKAELNFYFLGMKQKNVPVNKRSIINVQMEPDIVALEDVIVTGYQTISKERATGSFAVISPKEIENKLQANVMDRVEGMVAGLNIVKNGNSKSIQIRGISTINGNKNPLYVVDGVPFEGEPGSGSDNTSPLDMLNPADIVNITVLKDATAASIYGARSANGVVVITTKSGQSGRTRVNYSGSVNFQGLPDRDYSHTMTSKELVDYQVAIMETYPNVKRQTERNFQNPVQVLLLDYKDGKITKDALDKSLDGYRNLDRYDQVINEFLRSNRVKQQHNLSFNGGSEIYKYNVSVNYTGTAPYEKAQYLNRVGFNIKNTFDFFKWLQVDANIMGSQNYADYDCGALGMSLLGTGGSSYYMLRDNNGEPLTWYNSKSQYEIDRLISIGLQDENYYPVNELHNRRYTTKSNYLNLNFGAKFRIIDGLDVNLRYQRELTNGFSKDYYNKNSYTVNTMINDAARVNNGAIEYLIPKGGQIVNTNIDNYSYTMRGQVDYRKSFSQKHNLQALAGMEMRKVVTSGNGFYRPGYDDDNLAYSKIDELALSQGQYGTQALYGSFWFTNKTPRTTFVDNRYLSFYANASYQYAEKLTLTGSIRIDQSNLFGTDPKYQYRPLWSAGVQYLALKNYNWIDRLVVRATYGINGNIPKLNGPYLIAEVGRNNYYTNENTMYIASPPNPMLRWEKTNVFNLGVDFNLLSNRLNGSIEFYNKNTTDLLGAYSLDPTLGWSSVNMNFGSMYNRGIEIALSSVNITSGDFKWMTNLTFSYNKNMITKIETTSESASSYWSGLNNREGYPMDALFSVKYKGLSEKGAPIAIRADGSETLKYSELNKDDLVYSGTYNPPYNASLTNSLSYKGFDLSFMFIYSGGHVIRDIAARYCITSHPIYAVSNNLREMANYWKQPGDENNPDINPAFMFQSTVRNGEYIWKAADKHIQKGDFIKLRDVSLAYSLPNRLLGKTPISSAKIILQARNLWWWAANDSKLDPEIWTGSTLSPARGTLYPAEFTVGLNINF